MILKTPGSKFLKIDTEATTLMMMNDFSQLPVMSGERNVYGAISWRSIGVRRSLGHDCPFVRDCLEPVEIVPWEDPLFSILPRIRDRDYVLVSDREKRISGIVTTADISDQFRVMSEPFLLLGEIENHIRRIIANKYPLESLKAVRDPADQSRPIEAVSDLTFGEYLRLLENPQNWASLGIPLDRARFVEQLGRVRDIRNEVMHFDPDTEVQEDLKLLRDFARFMQAI